MSTKVTTKAVGAGLPNYYHVKLNGKCVCMVKWIDSTFSKFNSLQELAEVQVKRILEN